MSQYISLPHLILFGIYGSFCTWCMFLVFLISLDFLKKAHDGHVQWMLLNLEVIHGGNKNISWPYLPSMDAYFLAEFQGQKLILVK